jgi:hypothetical protein
VSTKEVRMEARFCSGKIVVEGLSRASEAARVAGAAMSLSLKTLIETDRSDESVRNARKVTVVDDAPQQSLLDHITKLVLMDSTVRGESPQVILDSIGKNIGDYRIDKNTPFTPGTQGDA